MIDKIEYFFFPDIPLQPYPIYLVNKSGKLANFKSIVYPNSTSVKRYTRKKQLRYRSQQAKIMDAIINIGYFDPLVVYREFPVPVQNVYRLPDQKRLYYILDYYFPNLDLAIELDSDYHDSQTKDPDDLRDRYLMEAHGIKVLRLRDLQKESVQMKNFREMAVEMKGLTPHVEVPLIFTNDLSKLIKTQS